MSSFLETSAHVTKVLGSFGELPNGRFSQTVAKTWERHPEQKLTAGITVMSLRKM